MLTTEEKLIAEIGGGPVMYSEVWCDRALAAANPRWLRGKSVDAACAEVERDRFGVIAARILIERVCGLEGLEPSDAQIEVQRPPILKNEAMLQDLVNLGRKRPQAVLRVYRGEDLETVFEEVIKPMNMPGSLDDFRKEVAMYRSPEVVERYLAKDWLAKARHDFEQMARAEARRAAVRKRIESIATAKNQSRREAADDYFKWMADRIGVRIHDARRALRAACWKRGVSMKGVAQWIVGAVLVASALVAQPADVVVKVEKKQNAQAQIEFARSLMWKVRAANNGHEKHVAVANVAANLQAVERAWPNNRAAIVEANALLAHVYVDGEMPRNAIETADRAVALAPDDHRLYVAAARAHARLGNRNDAAVAYEKAIETFSPAREEMMNSLSAMNDAAFFFEKEKQYALSAAALRHAAALRGLDSTVRVTLRLRALEQSARTPDRVAAKRDLAHLREAHRVALGTTLTHAGRQLLTIAENAIARFEKSLQ